MKCEICGKERHIVKVTQRFVNDHTPDLQTELWNDFTLACLNDACQMFAYRGWKKKIDDHGFIINPPEETDLKITTTHSARVV